MFGHAPQVVSSGNYITTHPLLPHLTQMGQREAVSGMPTEELHTQNLSSKFRYEGLNFRHQATSQQVPIKKIVHGSGVQIFQLVGSCIELANNYTEFYAKS
jgi:hypothetical protein